METYFDAHVYVGNFGTLVYMLRLPQTAVPGDGLAAHAAEDTLGRWKTGEHVIIEWRLDEERSGDWMEGEGWIYSLLPIREELLRGDYRSLYIGWLTSVQAGAWEYEDEEGEWEEGDFEEEEADDTASDDALEPSVPPGLLSLPPAQAALAEFLQIDSDVIDAAASASPDLPDGAAALEGVDRWVAGLPNEEVRSAVVRVVSGEALAVQTELQSRFYRATTAATKESPDGGRRRTARELLEMAERTERERKQREAAERERQRREHLAALAEGFPSLWEQVDHAAQKQTASGYDQATKLLADMRAAYDQAGREPEFEEGFARFHERYGGRRTVRRRLEEAGLLRESR
jgi:hypothetical protein